MELFGNLKKAFDLFWTTSSKMTKGLDVSVRSLVEARLQALQVGFQNAEERGDQAEMLRLAKAMTVLGDDLASYQKQSAG